ncbi:MAG: PulJ/GspJ family protein [Candidatus Xenobia bacterium]
MWPKKQDHSRGFSLLELLVAMVLFSVLITVVYAILVPLLHQWQNVQNDVALCDDMTVALHDLAFETSNCTVNNMVLRQWRPNLLQPIGLDNMELDSVGFLSPLDQFGVVHITQGGDLYWVKCIVYRVLDSGSSNGLTLHHQEFYLDQPVVNPRLALMNGGVPSNTLGIVTNPGLPNGQAFCQPYVDRTIARNIVGFSFTTNEYQPAKTYLAMGQQPPACNPITIGIWFKRQGQVVSASTTVSSWGDGSWP